MNNDYTTPTRRSASLIQAALALLVASTLVAFSVLAFRMGLATDRGRKVIATDADRAGGAVVLPALEEAERAPARGQRRADARIAITAESDEAVVLGTRIGAAVATSGEADTHKNQRGRGHDKARGRGHHKDDGKGNDDGDPSREEPSAREDEDDADDHSDEGGDRDDESNASGSGSYRGDRDDDSEGSGSGSDGDSN